MITPEQVAQLDAMENVRAIRRYKVNWGSVRHLDALLDAGDLPAIDASNCLFARKIDTGTAIYEALESRWLES